MRPRLDTLAHTVFAINMKTFLILALLVAVAFAGTRKAKPGEEKEALAMWKKYCDGGKDGGVIGQLFIHCKHHLGQVTRDINGGEVGGELGGLEEQRTQYIFVQPAPLHFNHNLQVKTSSGAEPKTVIYVRPAETSHSYNAELENGPAVEHEKPELVFLGDSSKGPKSGGAKSEAREAKALKAKAKAEASEEEEEEEDEDKPSGISGSANVGGAKISGSASAGGKSKPKAKAASATVAPEESEETLDKVVAPASKAKLEDLPLDRVIKA